MWSDVAGFHDRPPALDRIDEQEGGVGIAQDVGDAFGIIEGVHRYGNEALGQRRLVDRHMVDSARQEDRNPTAVLDPFGSQGAAPPTNLIAERPPAKALPRAGRRFEAAIGLASRRRADAPLEQLGQRADGGQIGVKGH